MLVVKVVTLVVAILVSILAVKVVMARLQAVRVPVKVRDPDPRRAVRLRQDPRSGVYFPED